ncbi:MAG TPA: hypothetical protein H9827_05840, partial [Candidatus Luteimonas excrementigallinarum]|nr:hypothetical protein [Candidatus Luteimonas excrementigallinarum]
MLIAGSKQLSKNVTLTADSQAKARPDITTLHMIEACHANHDTQQGATFVSTPVLSNEFRTQGVKRTLHVVH